MKVCLRCAQRFDGPAWNCPACGFAPEEQDGYLSFAGVLPPEDEGFEGNYQHLARLEAGNFWFQGRNRLLLWALQRYFPKAASMIEAGCGTGFVLEAIGQRFPAMRLCGTDLFTRGLPFASQRLPRAVILQMDARRIPFDNEFDVIGLFDVLEHVQEDETVLAAAFRAVKPGGGILLTVPQHPFLWSYLDEYSYHKRRYRRDELTRKIQAAGFQILRVTSFVSLLLPLMWLSRKRGAPKETFDPLAEFRIGKAANAILSLFMTLERWMIQAGVPFPAGGSLLVAARRPGS